MTWDIVKIAALVLALTQVAKGLRIFGWIPERIRGQAVSAIVTAVVVVVAWLLSGKPFDGNQVLQAIIAVIVANGGFKLLEKLEPPKALPYGP